MMSEVIAGNVEMVRVLSTLGANIIILMSMGLRLRRDSGRDDGYPPPAQIRTCNISAYGSSRR